MRSGCFRATFLSLARADILGQILLCRGATPCFAGVLQHSGFNSSDAHSTPSTPVVTPQNVSSHCQSSPVGEKVSPGWEPLLQRNWNQSPSNGAKEALDKCRVSASLPSLPFSEGIFYKFSVNLKTRMFEFRWPRLIAFSSKVIE